MLHGPSYELPLILAACGTMVACVVRCATLLLGLWLALKQAPNVDPAPLYRDFARAVARGLAVPWHTSREIRTIPEEEVQPAAPAAGAAKAPESTGRGT
jgi:hypothetical protein